MSGSRWAQIRQALAWAQVNRRPYRFNNGADDLGRVPYFDRRDIAPDVWDSSVPLDRPLYTEPTWSPDDRPLW